MPDWTEGMQQTFEYYEVDPYSWNDKQMLDNITDSNINRDESNDSLGNATIDSTEEFKEVYTRIYLKTVQNGREEKTPLGTYLIQTPNDKFNGRVHTFSYDAYTPLLELKENPPLLGYFVPKDSNIMAMAASICRDNCRTPVIESASDTTLIKDFVASDNDTWLSFVKDLIAMADYQIGLDELGRIIFLPIQDMASLQPVWTFDDGNSSILMPDVDTKRDLYGIPNVVEVVYTKDTDSPVFVRVVNDDPDSPTSTVSRGREIIYRDTSPSLNGQPTESEINKYAINLLRNLSTLEYTVTYTHGYCPVRLGDCVLLNYERAGIENVKARVISQSISCKPGCSVEETAVYTKKLWG